MTPIPDDLQDAEREAEAPLPGETAAPGTPLPPFAPTSVEIGSAMLPAMKRAQACLDLAVKIAEMGEEGRKLGDFQSVFTWFETFYLEGVQAYRDLHAAVPTAGTA